MGGLDSAVIDSSRNIFLESAFFSPQAILGEARQYGMHTDSSHRFERGVDYKLQRRACERATQLILDICGGKPGLVIEETSEQHLPNIDTFFANIADHYLLIENAFWPLLAVQGYCHNHRYARFLQ